MRWLAKRYGGGAIPRIIRYGWASFWMRFAGLRYVGRLATLLASWSASPFYGCKFLAQLSFKGYQSPRSTIHHSDLHLGAHVFIDDRVLIFEDHEGGPVELGEGVSIYRDTIIQTGYGGSVNIGPYTHIQPRCQISAYLAPIQIGSGVQIAPNCAFYPFDHGLAAGELIRKQPLQTKGGIIVGDDAWLGVGVIVLSGVRIGRGAVVGAGSVVTRNVPDYAIAVGVPARILKYRGDLAGNPVDRENVT